MANDERVIDIDIPKLLSTLSNEEELIVKPFQNSNAHEIGAVECGKIVSRLNKNILDYQIGDKANSSMINSIFSQRILLLSPQTKQVIVEFCHSRLPLLCKTCFKQEVRCLSTQFNQTQTIGSIQKRLVFGKLSYDVYDSAREHIVNLTLRTSHIRDKIQHRVPEIMIFDGDETEDIGRIYPFSTDLERSEYGSAIAMKIPQEMKVETKVTLLIGTLMLKSRIN